MHWTDHDCRYSPCVPIHKIISQDPSTGCLRGQNQILVIGKVVPTVVSERYSSMQEESAE